MALTFATYQAQILDLIPSMSSAQFTTMSPGMIDYAEGRIQRDLNLIMQVITDATGTLTPGARTFTFPSHFVFVSWINVLVGGSRTALTGTNAGFLNAAWPNASGATVPQWWAPLTDQTILVGPWPDGPYTVEVTGPQRAAPLSSTNTTTWISQYLPDLFVAASMVYASGWMRNFGSQADDPQMSASWERQYGALFSSVAPEEVRRQYAGALLGAPAPTTPPAAAAA